MRRLERPIWAVLVALAFAGGQVLAATPVVTLQPGESITIVAATAAPTVVPTPSPTVVPTPAPTPAPTPPPAGILVSPAELAALPRSGPAWDAMLAAANATWPAPNLVDMNGHHQLDVLAAAFTGQTTKARNGIAAALPTFNAGTENGALSMGRQLPTYVIAADVIGLRSLDSALDATFRADLAAWRDNTVGTHPRWSKLSATFADSSNNWGTHAGAAVIAIDAYLGRSLAADYDLFREFVGTKAIVAPHFPRPAIAEPSWVVNASAPWIPVQQAAGDPRDGAVTEDAWRDSPYPNVNAMYVMDSAQALALQAEILSRAGFAAWPDTARYRGFLSRSNWSTIWTTSGGRGGRGLAYLFNRRGLAVSTANLGDRQAWSLAWLDWLYPAAASAPTPVTTPAPTPIPTPTPAAGDPWATPFGSRPASGPISLSGAACQGVTISNKTIRDLAYPSKAIRLEGCNGVVIEQIDFVNVSEGVYAVNSSNITVRDSRYLNITGPVTKDASGRRTTTNAGNFVQLNNVNGALVQRNKGKCGDTEDIVSFTGSTKNATADGNHFEGFATASSGCLAWQSNSGSGIAVADGSAQNNVARNNIVVNPGQVGIFISGGTGGRIDNSIIVGERNALSNRPSYIAGAAGCNDEASGNRAYWIDKTGALQPLYDPGDGCTITQSSNNWTDTTLNIENYRVQL